MDIDEMRDMEIQYHRLKNADAAYTLYYDETNNARKLHVTEFGLNVPDQSCFVLGGVGHVGGPRSIDLFSLRKRARIQPSTQEIKLEHVAKGKFLDLLRSEKLGVVLDWIVENDLVIHFQVLDPLYWSTVDIVDSIFADARFSLPPFELNQVKDALYAVFRGTMNATFQLFRKFGYPDISPDQRGAFIDALHILCGEQVDHLSDTQCRAIEWLLTMALQTQSLPFIEDNERHTLIAEFGTFYSHRTHLLVRSTHIFDEEPKVIAELAGMPFRYRGRDVQNYRFADSKLEPLIQVSDVVAGFIGKYYTYLTSTSPETLVSERLQLSPAQLQNLDRLRKLVDEAHLENPVFIHRIISHTDQRKNDFFLHDLDIRGR